MTVLNVGNVENSLGLPHKQMMDSQLWERIVDRIIVEEDMERSLAERILNDALAFMLLCAANPQGRFSPSKLVDVGWHNFILYTREYMAFCEKIAGSYIHHAPFDAAGVDYGSGHVVATVEALKLHGISFDQSLWRGLHADCDGSCSAGSTCGGGGC